VENRIAFSVIVPYRNEAQHIGASFAALRQQSIPRHRYELLFVDNGSTDGTAALVPEGPGITLIREDRPGSYAARNAAIRRAAGEFLAFTDADCIPERDWLEQADMAMRDGGAAIAMGPRICPPRSALGAHLLQDYENVKMERILRQFPSRFAFGLCSNMIVRADVFRRVGLFDEWDRAADTAYVQRVMHYDPAYRVVFRPSMRVTHSGVHTTGQALRKMFVYGASNIRPARFNGYSPLDLRQRWGLFRLCCRNARYQPWHRFLLFGLLMSGGLLYKSGEVKGRICR